MGCGTMTVEYKCMEDTIVIKYDEVYTPNQDVCPGKQYSSFVEMQAECGEALEAAAAKAEKLKMSFTPYRCKHVLKPEFRKKEST